MTYKEMLQILGKNETKYRKLWQVTTWDKHFTGVEKEKQKDVIRYKYLLAKEFDEKEDEKGDILYIATGIGKEKRYTNEKLAEGYIEDGEVVCIPGGGTPNVKYHQGRFVTGDNRIATSSDTDVLDNKYLYYWMQENLREIGECYRGGTIKHPEMKKILEMEIPVPPLPVQQWLANFLDEFSSATKKLQALLQEEIGLRKKQYTYYRDKLLTEKKDDWKEIPIEDVCNISSGRDINKEHLSKIQTEQYSIPVISNGIGEKALYGYTDKAGITVPSVTVSARGTVGYATYRDYPYYPIIRLLSVSPKNSNLLNVKYLYYALSARTYVIPKSGIPQLTIPMFKQKIQGLPSPYLLSVPPLSEQQRIVSILDPLEQYTNELVKQIPNEIKGRQQQYEYYRNMLFEKLKSVDING